MPLIGTHVSAAGGLDKAFARADALSCEAMQIFTRNQLQWHGKPVSCREAEDFYRAWQASSVKKVVAHASYLINIASNDKETLAKSRAALSDETERCAALGISDIVLHPGYSKDGDASGAINRIVESLSSLFEATAGYGVRILLETMAGQGTSVGRDLVDFAKIGWFTDWPPRLGFCVDTAHVFAAGYDLRTAENYERFISLVDKNVGTDKIFCWHLNDSKSALGSRVDRHAHLGEGNIGLAPFALLMNDGRFSDVPAILETPKDGVGDTGNLSFLRKARGR